MPWPLPKESAERLALAKGYPYPAPPKSYLLSAGAVRPLEAGEAARSVAGRQPVIAHGSNRSPEQLLRKYGATAEIPVTYAWLADYDVVYAAHVTRYASIASTLHHAPGCAVRIAVTWLDAVQLRRMHETEGAKYLYGALEGASFACELGLSARLAAAPPTLYLYRLGALAEAGAPLGLAALEARNRRHAARDQLAILEWVRARHHGAEALDALLLSLQD
ncbi:MAG: hypothetical protein ACREGK_08885, partial [Geminicoccales bacterium]